MTTVHTLASGSSGNALVISCGTAHILVDAGISCRRITRSLSALGLTLADLDGLLITHTHSDHISGMKTLLKHSSFPIHSTHRTARGLCDRFDGIQDRLDPLEADMPTELDCGLVVTPVTTSHDCPGSCGFRIDTPCGSVGILTDTGFVTDAAAELLPGVDAVVLEANHDTEMVLSGPYPYALKQRILGPLGHLSNPDSARFAVKLAEAGASQFILAHLSQDNNTPVLARSTVETALSAGGFRAAVTVAPRETLSGACTVFRRSVCKR